MKITKRQLKGLIKEVIEETVLIQEDSVERERKQKAPYIDALEHYRGKENIRQLIKDAVGYYPESKYDEAEILFSENEDGILDNVLDVINFKKYKRLHGIR